MLKDRNRNKHSDDCAQSASASQSDAPSPVSPASPPLLLQPTQPEEASPGATSPRSADISKKPNVVPLKITPHWGAVQYTARPQPAANVLGRYRPFHSSNSLLDGKQPLPKLQASPQSVGEESGTVEEEEGSPPPPPPEEEDADQHIQEERLPPPESPPPDTPRDVLPALPQSPQSPQPSPRAEERSPASVSPRMHHTGRNASDRPHTVAAPLTPMEPAEEASPIALFNKSPKKGIAALVASGAIENTPVSIANFLFANKGLSKDQVGDYLSEPNNTELLACYLKCFSFSALGFEMALRHFLYGFKLPGEAQKIDRLMQGFANAYYATADKGLFLEADAIYVLAYSVIMLNTDLHNPSVKHKMTLPQFISNNRKINQGKDLPRPFLRQLYEQIADFEIKTHDPVFPKAIKVGWLLKSTGMKSARRFFVLCPENGFIQLKSPTDSSTASAIPLNMLRFISAETIGERVAVRLKYERNMKKRTMNLVAENKYAGRDWESALKSVCPVVTDDQYKFSPLGGVGVGSSAAVSDSESSDDDNDNDGGHEAEEEDSLTSRSQGESVGQESVKTPPVKEMVDIVTAQGASTGKVVSLKRACTSGYYHRRVAVVLVNKKAEVLCLHYRLKSLDQTKLWHYMLIEHVKAISNSISTARHLLQRTLGLSVSADDKNFKLLFAAPTSLMSFQQGTTVKAFLDLYLYVLAENPPKQRGIKARFLPHKAVLASLKPSESEESETAGDTSDDDCSDAGSLFGTTSAPGSAANSSSASNSGAPVSATMECRRASFCMGERRGLFIQQQQAAQQQAQQPSPPQAELLTKACHRHQRSELPINGRRVTLTFAESFKKRSASVENLEATLAELAAEAHHNHSLSSSPRTVPPPLPPPRESSRKLTPAGNIDESASAQEAEADAEADAAAGADPMQAMATAAAQALRRARALENERRRREVEAWRETMLSQLHDGDNTEDERLDFAVSVADTERDRLFGLLALPATLEPKAAPEDKKKPFFM
eukprot:TRINITY_DN1975_c0_g1_i5.p1 TRINITY_DN1975_c0_g1~~TRINITY_DN1975_c0_g1_i5.p1  ORF type:complete len:1003 (+),score=278.17 TRINITY_DN1975_c0_g1_i5:216-3224(+)